MANPTIRAFSVWIGGKKAATVNKQSVKINPRREPMFDADGNVIHSKGAVTFDITVNEITPMSGSSLSALNKKIVNQEDVEMAVGPIGGKLLKCTMSCTGAGYESDSESGKATGDATFSGGVPTIQG